MKYRIVIGKLQARTAIHIGSGVGNDVADMLVRRDAAGEVTIPGTAIAGALRALLTRLAPRFEGVEACRALLYSDTAPQQAGNKGCGCAVCRLLGDIEPSDEAEVTTAASRLLVFNAPLQNDAFSVFRDGVGIDRRTGAAARQTAAKYDLEVIPAGACFELRMELRAAEITTLDEQLLAAALAEWQAGRLTLGGDVARGLGAFELTALQYYIRDLDDADNLMAFLRNSEPWALDQTALPVYIQDMTPQLTEHLKGITIVDASVPCVTTGWAAWEFTLQAQGPFLTHDTTTAGLQGFAHAPLLNKTGDLEHPVLPGSSLRGVLRSHAERIARTLASHQAITEDDPAAYFLQHCPACDPLARRLETTERHTALESCDSLLHFEVGHSENEEVPPDKLCLACQLFGSTRNGSRFRVEDAPFAGDKPVYKMLDFLAIDRFTGGGADHLKFDALALWKPAFTVRVWLDNPEEWELGWLALVLRDLTEGWLRVGFGAAKGFGEVTITNGTFQRATLPLGKVPEDATSVFTVEKFVLADAALHSQQSHWLAKFREKVQQTAAYRNEALMTLPADSYFGTKVAELYPLTLGETGGAS